MNQTIAAPTPSACFFTDRGSTSLQFRLNHKAVVITMKDRSKNRKPLQRGRNLSIEAIQAVQALKRANRNTYNNPLPELERVFDFKFRRLLKFDMMAVLRELLRQNECLLALKVRFLSSSSFFFFILFYFHYNSQSNFLKNMKWK